MNLRSLVGEEQWEMLKQDTPDLDLWLYVCKCETCKKVFFETNLKALREMTFSGKWKPDQPMLWYIQAGRHWVANKFHSIRVLSINPDHRERLIMDLSAEWRRGSKGYGFTDAAMLNELDYLEKQIRSKNISK